MLTTRKLKGYEEPDAFKISFFSYSITCIESSRIILFIVLVDFPVVPFLPSVLGNVQPAFPTKRVIFFKEMVVFSSTPPYSELLRSRLPCYFYCNVQRQNKSKMSPTFTPPVN